MKLFKIPFLFSPFLLILSLVSGCASNTAGKPTKAQTRQIEDQQSQTLSVIMQNQRKIDSIESELRTLNDKVLINQADIKNEMGILIKSVENFTGKLEANSHHTQAMITRVESMGMRLNDMHMMLMEANLSNSNNSEMLRSDIEDSFLRLSMEIEELLKAIEGKTERKVEGGASIRKEEKRDEAKATSPVPQGISAEELYHKAYRNFLRRNYSQASLEFGEYVRRFPRDELSDDSQYWRSESLAKIDKLKDSVEAFMDVEVKYPGSNKASIALWRASQMYEKLDDLARRDEILSKLKDNYPDSYEAVLAREKLKSGNE